MTHNKVAGKRSALCCLSACASLMLPARAIALPGTYLLERAKSGGFVPLEAGYRSIAAPPARTLAELEIAAARP